jgi:hypothetical protein
MLNLPRLMLPLGSTACDPSLQLSKFPGKGGLVLTARSFSAISCIGSKKMTAIETSDYQRPLQNRAMAALGIEWRSFRCSSRELTLDRLPTTGSNGGSRVDDA